MFLDLLFHTPALALVWLFTIVIAFTVHEFSHALMGSWRGDQTAEREGRLTLNPLAHIDWFGFLPLLLLGFGWAKPVPFNPYNLKNPRWDSVLIAFAGPISNLFLASLAAFLLRFFMGTATFDPLNLLSAFLFLTILINLFLLFFNVIPVHPLDGSKLFFALFDAPRYERLRFLVASRGPQVLFFLVLLSLIGFPVFSFLTVPAFLTCDALLGESCLSFFSLLFAS